MKPEIKLYGQGIGGFWTIATQRSMVFGWITLGIIVFLSLYIWYEVKNATERDTSERFEVSTNEITNAIQKRMSAYEQVLRGGKGLFAVSDTVTRDEWRRYVENLEVQKNFPGILGIGYSAVITAGAKEKHERMVRAEGFPLYKIWPENKKDIYTSIVYLEPFEGRNLRAFGYDMMSESIRYDAMTKARDSGRITVSDKVTLVQETAQDVQAGFLMYIPHYQKGVRLNTVEERRKALVGFVYSPFRASDLMRGILSETLADINLEIYADTVSKKNLMYVSSPVYLSLESGHHPMFSKDRVLNINDNQWHIRFSTLPSFEESVGDDRPLFVLVAGLLTSALIFVLVLSLASNNYLFRELNHLIESTSEGIYGLDKKGRCTFINSAASKMLQRKPDEFYDKVMHNVMHYKHEDGKDYNIHDCPIYNAFHSRKIVRVDNEVFWRPDGTYFPVEYSASPIYADNELKGLVVTFNDITERKETVERLSSSLQEKVVLLKEVHHRVKNNLQIISSLLNLQSQYLLEPQSQELFKESQNRIRSMALIHEKLYQTNNMSRLNFAGYVHELVMNLLHSYDTTGKVTFRMDVEDVLLNIDIAITLGLMINEIVSNSLKHAFPGNRHGEIYISLKERSKDHFSLAISDNGIGLSNELDFRNTATLGLQLVNTLTEQLEGNIELDTRNGTRFIITFIASSEKENIHFNS